MRLTWKSNIYKNKITETIIVIAIKRRKCIYKLICSAKKKTWILGQSRWSPSSQHKLANQGQGFNGTEGQCEALKHRQATNVGGLNDRKGVRMRITNTCTITSTLTSQVRKPKTTLRTKSCRNALQVIAFYFLSGTFTFLFRYFSFSFFRKSLALYVNSKSQKRNSHIKVALMRLCPCKKKMQFRFLHLAKYAVSNMLRMQWTTNTNPNNEECTEKFYANLQILNSVGTVTKCIYFLF